MGNKLNKIPPNMSYSNNECNLCKNKIRFETRIDKVGVNYIEDCGSCTRCQKKKGCGGYESVCDELVVIPICDNCNKCIRCNKILFDKDNEYYLEHNAFTVLNDRYLCKECSKKSEFNNKWKSMNITDKLEIHGLKKLHVLAKEKNIKGFSKLSKGELIAQLLPCVKDSDFHIK